MMIISIAVFYLLIFPFLMKIGRVPDGKEHCLLGIWRRNYFVDTLHLLDHQTNDL